MTVSRPKIVQGHRFTERIPKGHPFRLPYAPSPKPHNERRMLGFEGLPRRTDENSTG
jgi:hypothetical protein